MKIPKQSREEKELDQWNDLLEKTFAGTARTVPVRREPESRPVYKRPVFWSILALVLIIAAAWFVIQAVKKAELTPEEKNELAALEQCKDALAQCKAALENHQAQTASKIVIDTTAFGVTVQYTYWRDGDDRLVHHDVTNWSYLSGWLLRTGGTTYCQGIAAYYPEDATGYTDWVATELVSDSSLVTWLDRYQWNDEDITLVSTGEEDGNTLVTFTVAGGLPGDPGSDTVTFCLNDAGALVYALADVAITYTDADAGYRAISAGKFRISYDASEIRSMIQEKINEVSQTPMPLPED